MHQLVATVRGQDPGFRPDVASAKITRSLLCVLAWGILALVLIVTMGLTDNLWLNHFTWWGWICQGLFFSAWSMWGLTDAFGLTSEAEGFFLLHTAPFMFSILSAIAVLIALLPIIDDGIIEAQSGDMSLGVVNIGNIFVHYVPCGVCISLLGQRAEHVRAAYRQTKDELGGAPSTQLTNAVWLSGVVLPLAFGGIYASWYDFQQEYTVNVDHAVVYVAGLMTLVVCTLVLWCLLFPMRVC